MQLNDAQQRVAAQCKADLDAVGLTIAQFAAWANAPLPLPVSSAAANKPTMRLVLAYLGLMCIFVGIGSFIGMHWKEFDSFMRILMTAGLGIGLLNGSIVMQRRGQWPEYLNGAYLISLFLLTTGLFVTLKELSNGNDVPLASILVFGTMLSLSLLLFQSLRQAVFIFASVICLNGFMWGLMEKAQLNDEPILLGTGLMNWFIAYGLQARGFVRCTLLANIIGLFSLAAGLFQLVHEENFWDLSLFAGSAAVMWYGTKERYYAKLLLGALFLFGTLTYFTAEYFADTAGWPICLILLGGAFFGLAHTTRKLMDQSTT